MAATQLIGGLDLGQVADFTVLTVLERSPRPRAHDAPALPRRKWQYALRWAEAWELGTKYTQIVEDVRDRYSTDALKWTRLAVDMTGVGVAVVDQLRSAKVPARMAPVVITAGHKVTRDPKTGEYHVPKKELVSTLVVLLQAGLLKWPAADWLPKGKFKTAVTRLEKELAEFRIKVTRAANETFSGDKSQHDDAVLSLMLAAWLGENSGGGDVSGIAVQGADEGVLAGGASSFATGGGIDLSKLGYGGVAEGKRE